MIPEAFIRLLEKYETSELSQAEMERFKKMLKNPDVKAFMREREQLELDLNQLAQTKLDVSMVDSLIPQITNEMESRLLVHGLPADGQQQDDVVPDDGSRVVGVKKWFGYFGAGVAAAACIGMAVLLYPQIQSDIERPLDEGLYSDVVTQKSQAVQEESASSMEMYEQAITDEGAAEQGEGVQGDAVAKAQTDAQQRAVAKYDESVMYSKSQATEEAQRKSSDAGSSASEKANQQQTSSSVQVPSVKQQAKPQSKSNHNSGSSSPSNTSQPYSGADTEVVSPPKKTQPSDDVKHDGSQSDRGATPSYNPSDSNDMQVLKMPDSDQSPTLKSSNSTWGGGMQSMGTIDSYEIKVQNGRLVIVDEDGSVVGKSAYVVRNDAEKLYPVGWQVYGSVYRYKLVGATATHYFDMNLVAGTESVVR
jgi:hypothetical protein